MADKGEADKEENLISLMNKYDGTTHQDTGKKDMAADKDRFKSFMHADHQRSIRKHSTDLMRDLYNSSFDSLKKGFGENGDRKLGKDDKEALQKVLLEQYLEKFYKAFMPGVLKDLEGTTEEKFEFLAAKYDRFLGVGTQNGPEIGIQGILDSAIDGEHYTLGNLMDHLEAVTTAGTRGSHLDALIGKINFKKFNHYLGQHMEEDALHQDILTDLEKIAKDYKMPGLSVKGKNAFKQAGAGKLMGAFSEVYHGQRESQIKYLRTSGYDTAPPKEPAKAPE
ncbi:MAG: hypothetical protein KKG59_01115 [Nanoarchaeota archaeon]|nr:hypothetical protein [Nanoarchaeota archaeon]